MNGPPIMFMYRRLNTPKATVRGNNAFLNLLQMRLVPYWSVNQFVYGRGGGGAGAGAGAGGGWGWAGRWVVGVRGGWGRSWPRASDTTQLACTIAGSYAGWSPPGGLVE
jgi:hypothetical protein